MRDKQQLIKDRGANLTQNEIQALGDRNREIARLKKTGWTWSEIAKKYNLSREYVKAIGHRFGARGNYNKNKKKVATKKQLSFV